ncbi:hypothetical protein [Caldisalinibacter kiritimatiensis]|nr:hypothetical protein [Caldisalinibacter kiritimatiensis]
MKIKDTYRKVLMILGILVIVLLFVGYIIRQYFDMRAGMFVSASIPPLVLIFVILLVFSLISRK